MPQLNKYRNIGFKLTPQRIAILDYLEGNTGHPSVEEIHTAVAETFPTMSLATVYTTLAALKEKGSVLELTIDPDRKRYDPQTASHSHLICIACKRIVDMPGTYQPDPPDSVKKDFTVIKSHVEAYGFCPECKNKNTDRTKEIGHVRRS